jgi:DNA-binding CsgD family transcriptional regulator
LEAQLLDLIYGAVADPERWDDVLVGVADHLGGLGGMLAYVPPRGSGQPPTQILGRLPEEPSTIFREHYAWNPWTEAVTKVPFGKAVSANSLVEPGSIQKTAFYADVLAPWGHADILDINYRGFAVDGSVGGFGFCLSERGADDADRRVRLLDRLSPHLCRALDASLLLGDRADGQRHLSAMLDLMPNAAVLLDHNGRITQTNRAADELLHRSDGIAFDADGGLQLVCALTGEQRQLSRALKDALAVASGLGTSASQPVRISRPSGAAQLVVLAVPLPQPAFPFMELTAPARVLVVIVDPAAKARASAAAIQAAFGLTRAEARVALLLASGVAGAQMPAMLGVTAATIKTQLRHCFEKTGTHSQVELARLFAIFPPNHPADR